MIRVSIKQKRWVETLLAAGLLCLPAVQSSAVHNGPDVPLDRKRLASLREMGRRHDRQTIPDLLAVLREQPAVSTDLGLTAIHSLAQMGAEEALPDMDAYAAAQRDPVAKQFPNDRVVNYVRVARARLVAEASVSDLKDGPQRTTAEVARLCEELGLSAADIKKAAARNKVWQTPFNHPPTPVEVYAMREIADILYDSPVRDYKSVPIAGGLDLTSDYPTSLKMGLVSLPPADRLNWLINDLAHKKVVADDEEYEIQLAEDYGVSASKAAVTRLAQMDDHREEYKTGGFYAMIHIVYAAGYQDQVREHFQSDPDRSVAEAARTGVSVKNVPGY